MSPYVITILLWCLRLGSAFTISISRCLLACMRVVINALANLPVMAQHHHPPAVEPTTNLLPSPSRCCCNHPICQHHYRLNYGSMKHLLPIPPRRNNPNYHSLSIKSSTSPRTLTNAPCYTGLNPNHRTNYGYLMKAAPNRTNRSNGALDPRPPMNNPTNTIPFHPGRGSFNTNWMTKNVSHSSNADLGWMINVSQFKRQVTLLLLNTYMIMTSAKFLTYKLVGTTNFNTVAMCWGKDPAFTAMPALPLLPLGGLRPLTGLMPNWFILHELTMQGVPGTATMITLTALFSLYCYLRLCCAVSFSISPNSNNDSAPCRLLNTQPTARLATLMVMTLLHLPITRLAESLTN
uniref:NADH-ubiquinone oxidoreductase chain 2 n=1 Tax=Ameiurus melas TaxID=219545 RepID=A0A0S3H844_AMEME|nr:NADH dehydrogenase subunit 2 [Ameiurus melas]